MADAALTQVGRYRILAELGRGAMGVVYRAEDPLLNRAVAIKTIIMSTDAEERAEYEARFYQEAKAAGGLNHPNVITVHDIGRDGDMTYMAMELLEGTDLRELMRRGPLPLRTALDLAAQVADGLAFAHERGVVHRDIKPGNIMIVRDRHAKIMDFGIASVRISDVKTQVGAILGSPRYMSPEQVRGQRASFRSDIYSLGVVLYELTAGQPPFAAEHVTQLMHLVTTATPRAPSLLNAAVPPMLDLIVAKTLEKDPDARYQSAAELAADLRACLAGIVEEPAAAGLAGAVAAPLDMQLGATSPGAGAAKTSTSGVEATSTRPLAATEARTAWPGSHTRATDALLVSRRFDSTAAVKQIVDVATGGGSDAGDIRVSFSQSLMGALKRTWRIPERRIFSAAVITATVLALLIVVW